MIRPYRPGADDEALWRLKRAFELELGSDTGGSEKSDTYRAKLDDRYRERYLGWVDECVREEECIILAEADRDVLGYAFVLPERLSMIWDAAVLNEVYVAEDHRGTGIGDELMEAVLEITERQELPLDRIVLDVDRRNDRAQGFYRRYGFEHWGEMLARSL